MQPYQHLFFDLDDTLWDFRRNSEQALRLCWEEFFLETHFVSFEEMHAQYQEHNLLLWKLFQWGRINREELMRERFNRLLLSVGISDLYRVERLNAFYLDRLAEQKSLMPHAREVLESLSERYPLSIITNGFSQVQYRKLRSSGIAHYFTHVVFSEEATVLKPHPAIFRLALSRAGVAPQEALFVGDNFEVDICGAYGVGIDQFFYHPGGEEVLSAAPFMPTYHSDSLRTLQECV